MIKGLPCNAGDASLIPGLGTKIPYAVEWLGPCTATTDPMYSGACWPQLASSVLQLLSPRRN